LSAARRLRAVSWPLEVALFLVIVGSVAAIGSVHPLAYALWFACLAIGLLLAVKVSAVASLRRVHGRQRFAYRWITLDADPGDDVSGWSFDLREPALPRPALLLPGAVFVGWVVFQLLPLPPDFKPSTLSLPDTLRGLAFLASGLVLHLAAASVFTMREARERFRRALATLGAILSLVALTQLAAGTSRSYGVFQPLENSGAIFSPFVNGNHCAGLC
jgi:hypothetical protein